MTDLSKGQVLVTGGAGFIGSALVWALNQRGIANILIADCLGDEEKWKNLVPLRFADYIEADDLIERIDLTPNQFTHINAIFHLGACSSTTETDAGYLIRNNYEFTKTLAHFALEGGRRFVYASSAATYGALEERLSEARPLESLRPLNMYGYSKHLFDSYAEQNGMLDQITGLKYFNVFGPNEDHKGDMRSLVNKAFHQIKETGRTKLFKSHRAEFKDGEQRRDFLYVKDAVEATVFLAESVNGGGIFNIGSGEANTWLCLANSIFEALDLSPQIEFIDMPEQLQRKYQYFTCADISKLRDAGFTCRITPLRDGVRDYVKNYLIPNRRLGD